MYTLSTIAVAGAAIAVLDGWLPYASKYEALPPHASVAQVQHITEYVVKLDVRTLTWQLESIRRQIHAARRACKQGDSEACDEVRGLEKDILHAEHLLRKVRGF